MILGRFSPSFMIAIAVNLTIITGIAAMLWKRDAVNLRLRRLGYDAVATAYAIIFVFTSFAIILLTQVGNIVDRAEWYLVSSGLTILVLVGRQLLVVARRRLAGKLGVLSLFLLAASFACLAALIFMPVYAQGFLPTRILEPVAYLIVFSGLVWGTFLGCLTSFSVPRSAIGRFAGNLLRLANACIFLVFALGMVFGHAALIPDFQTHAREWDARHRHIIDARDSGLTVIEVEPLTFSIDSYVGKGSLGKEPVTSFAEMYYGVDDIILKDS